MRFGACAVPITIRPTFKILCTGAVTCDVLVASDLPPIGDADEMEAFQKAGTPVLLRAFHLRDGRTKELARRAGKGFHPKAGENDSIEVESGSDDSTDVLPPPWP